MTVRWLSQEEFRDGEEQNPYAPEPASLRQLKAVPQSNYNWWMVGATPMLFSALNRRRKAVAGEVWMPDAAKDSRAFRRRLVRLLVVFDVVLLAFTAWGSEVAPLAFVALTFVGIPATEFAAQRAGMRAWIDYRTRLIGVDAGLRRRRHDGEHGKLP